MTRFGNSFFLCVSLQERVQEGLEDGARLPSLDVEVLRGENSSLREEQQRLKKVSLFISFLPYIDIFTRYVTF